MQGVVSMGLLILAGVFFLKVAWNLTVPFELARRKDERAGKRGQTPRVMKRLFLLVWTAALAAVAAGAEVPLPDEGEVAQEVLPIWSPMVGEKAKEGKVAFMGFDYGEEVEWEPGEHFVFDAWPGRYLARKFALETPWHGFESVEAWGDVDTRLPMALVFERYVPEGSMEDAEKWMEKMVQAFPEECGIELLRTDCGGDCREARGMKGGLAAWVCAGWYVISRPVGESVSETVWESEEGVLYQVRIKGTAPAKGPRICTE